MSFNLRMGAESFRSSVAPADGLGLSDTGKLDNPSARPNFSRSRDLTCHGAGEHTVGTGLANGLTEPPRKNRPSRFRSVLPNRKSLSGIVLWLLPGTQRL